MDGRRTSSVFGFTAAVVAACAPVPAVAQAHRNFEIPSQPLVRALPAFARQAGIQILAPTDQLADVRAPALSGAFEARAALRRLISGSGLEIVSDRNGVILLAMKPPPPQQRMIDGEPALLEEVVVTALRRETAASRTPVSVVVLPGAALESRGATSLTDLQASAPSLNLTEINPGQRRLSLRGAQSAGENTVALYLGETPVTGPNSATSDPSSITPDIDLYDSARIEVLKGPQGTLFGSGAMSGAVRVLYNTPAMDERSARLDVAAGRIAGGGRGGALHAMINLPVAPERLAVRLVGYASRRPGYIDNLVLDRNEVNAVRVHGGRVAVRYTPSNLTTFTVSALVQDQVVEDSNAFDGTAGDYLSTYAARLPFPNRFALINAVLQHDFGFARMVASSSWYDWSATKYIDTTQAALVARANGTYCARYVGISGVCNPEQLGRYRDYVTSILPVVGHQPMGVQSRIHEVRLESRPGMLMDWTMGVFVEDRSDFSTSSTVKSDPATGAALTPLQYVFQRQSGVDLVQTALFGELGYALTPALKVRLGARNYLLISGS